MPRALSSVRQSLSLAGVLSALLCYASPVPISAEPNADTCSNRVLVRFVYAVMLSQGNYEYRAYIRNLTRDTLGWTMWLGSLPEGVSAPAEHPMRGVLAPYAGETLRIGRGPTAAINLGTVDVLYDRTGGAQPFVSLRSCVLRPR